MNKRVNGWKFIRVHKVTQALKAQPALSRVYNSLYTSPSMVRNLVHPGLDAVTLMHRLLPVRNKRILFVFLPVFLQTHPKKAKHHTRSSTTVLFVYFSFTDFFDVPWSQKVILRRRYSICEWVRYLWTQKKKLYLDLPPPPHIEKMLSIQCYKMLRIHIYPSPSY